MQWKMMVGVQRIGCLSLIPLLAGLKYPAGVFVYWISNNLFSLCQVTLNPK
jgi:membrane protein insertase Oxa1/YidC/SpoIIIJ